MTDFGVMAGVVQSPRAQADVLARSAPYHAPELSMKQPGSVAGDIYALGRDPLRDADRHAPVCGRFARRHCRPSRFFAHSPASRHQSGRASLRRRHHCQVPAKAARRPLPLRRGTLSDLKSVRDALRFGKPLSWSPVDVDKLANDVSSKRREQGRRREERRQKTEDRRSTPKPETSKIPKIEEPVAVAAASSQALPMPANNRLRKNDERVSILLKIAIGIVTGIIFACLIASAAASKRPMDRAGTRCHPQTGRQDH